MPRYWAMTGLHGVTIPILASRDVDETAAFYRQLGFEVVARYDQFGPPYLLLRRDDVELHFAEDANVDPAHNDGSCYLRLDDAQAVYDEWAPLRLGLDAVRPLRDTPWGMREFAVVDPSGNLLRIGTRVVER
jgi:catechol 2,3-dioxygenase-like lactoylglutathione lyase family enzyme